MPTEPAQNVPALAAILLAAGSSRRYGTDNKLLATIDGVPLVRRVALALASFAFREIIVVTGHDDTAITHALAPVIGPLRFVHNPRHSDGMGRSIAVGMAAVSATIIGVLIAQADMPDVDADLIARLCQRFRAAGGDRITAPWIADTDHSGGRTGNPVVWPARLFADFGALDGDRGGKALVEAAGASVERVIITTTAAAIDIDTPAQLAAYQAARRDRG